MGVHRVLRHPDTDGGAGLAGPTIRAEGLEAEPVNKIRAFDQKLVGGNSIRGGEQWARKPSVSGTGATHVKSFHCKLGGESLEFLDRQINEWLDTHPEIEVKFVTSTVGEWTGKLKEPNLIVQLWV